MSKLIVEVCEVLSVEPHDNADALDIATIKGWPVVVQKSLAMRPGDPVVFFPPDTVMPEELADRLGIRKYLAPVKTDGNVSGYRVRATRLRGVASYGTIDHAVPDGCRIGDDVAELYGVSKWEPPIRSSDDDILPEVATFHKYTDIENFRNHPDVFVEGETVQIREKAHGMNGRIGVVMDRNENGEPELTLMAGSHNTRRKQFSRTDRLSPFWKPLDDRNLSDLIHATKSIGDVIVFFELIGDGVQDMRYGHNNGSTGYLAFDISINGRYLDADEKTRLFADYNIPTAPVLYEGPFSREVVERLTDGDTTICEPKDAGKFKGREGIVITPIKERRDEEIGRVILKSVSADYLARKNATDSH